MAEHTLKHSRILKSEDDSILALLKSKLNVYEKQSSFLFQYFFLKSDVCGLVNVSAQVPSRTQEWVF